MVSNQYFGDVIGICKVSAVCFDLFSKPVDKCYSWEKDSLFMFDLVSYVRNTLHGKRQIGRNFGGLESSTKKKVIIISNLIKIFSLFLIYLGWTFVKHFYRLIMSTSGSACEILCQRPSIPWYVCRNDAKFSLLRNFHLLDIMFH